MGSRMAENRNHHFVPQFYLRRFGQSGSIALFNIDRRKHVPRASIAGQSQRPYLYGRDSVVESSLCALEGAAADAIRRAIDARTPPSALSDDHASLLKFIVCQWGRTPAAGQAMQAMTTKMARAVLKFPGTVPDDMREHIDALELRYDNPILHTLELLGPVTPVLVDLAIVILVNNTNLEFVAADSPVVLHNAWCEGVTWQGTTGFASSGLQIVLPVDPRHALLLFDREVYAVGCKQDPRCVDVGERDVEQLNQMQMWTAQHNIYYSGDQATSACIDALSTAQRRVPEDRVVVRRALDDEQRSQIVHLFQRNDARMALSFLRVLKRKLKVPLNERARSNRTVASRIAREVIERKEGTSERRGPRPGATWTVVDDDS
jgi:hypothetical protein